MTARVLVTGANGGIGLATVLELARRGHEVTGSVRSEDKAAEVRRAAADAGLDVGTVLLDVRDESSAASAIDEVRPTILVNNAGLAEPGAIEDVDIAEAHKLLDTLAIGPIRLARLAVPHMREAGGGRIINVSSILARVPAPVLGWYSAAKRALEGASEALRLEVAGDDIRVILVQPGGINTDVFSDARRRLGRREDAGTSYAATYRAWSQLTQHAERLMSSPELVARTIAAAAEGQAKARYLVGLDARLIDGVERVAPSSIRDAAARLLLRL